MSALGKECVVIVEKRREGGGGGEGAIPWLMKKQ